MFKIARSNVILWPVSIALPVDGGKTQEVKVKVKFNRMPEDDYMALVEKYRGSEGEAAANPTDFNVGLLRELVADWPDLADEDSQPLEYAPEHLERMLRGPDGLYISNGLFSAYNDIRFGSRQKN